MSTVLRTGGAAKVHATLYELTPLLCDGRFEGSAAFRVQHHGIGKKIDCLISSFGRPDCTLHHCHPSRAEIITWTSRMFQSGDVIQITERLHEMVQAVEKCASSLRAVQPMSGDHCLLNHVHQEQLSDEKLLELLHNTFVQFLTSSRAVYP